jgi:putative hydrolase of the HAD superfamily
LRAIVFDLDDTLYLERAFVESGFRAVADRVEGRLGLAPGAMASELMSSFDAGVRGDTFDRFLAGHGVEDDDLVGWMVDLYRGHRPTIEPYVGAREMLVRLRGRFLLGLLTDGPAEVQRRKLRALGLAQMFDAAVFSDDLGRQNWKPSPRPFEAVLDLLGVPATEAVYVADNPIKDFLGPTDIGMHTIRIRHTEGLLTRLEPQTQAHAPSFEVRTFEELEALVTPWAPA